MKKYESVFILDIRKIEDEGDAFTKEFTGLVEAAGGKVEKAESMGRKQFVREIKKRKAGIYWNYIFHMPPEEAAGLKDKFKHDERVVRELIINYDKPEELERTEKETEKAGV